MEDATDGNAARAFPLSFNGREAKRNTPILEEAIDSATRRRAPRLQDARRLRHGRPAGETAGACTAISLPAPSSARAADYAAAQLKREGPATRRTSCVRGISDASSLKWKGAARARYRAPMRGASVQTTCSDVRRLRATPLSIQLKEVASECLGRRREALRVRDREMKELFAHFHGSPPRTGKYGHAVAPFAIRVRSARTS